MALVNRLKQKMETKVLENSTKIFHCPRCNNLGIFIRIDHFGFYRVCVICGFLEDLDYFEIETMLGKVTTNAH